MSKATRGQVLVVDDNRVNRRILEVKLGEVGYAVASAESGSKALEILALGGEAKAESGGEGEGSPSAAEAAGGEGEGEGGAGDGAGRIDLVLLDIMMPDLDGMEVLRRIRKARSPIQLPVIMATAKDESTDVIEALHAGANDYVTKPIDLPVLLSRVQTQLELRRLHEDLRGSHRSLVRAAKMESVALLAAGVAHEIRNPLTQISMGLDGVRRAATKGDAATLDEILEMLGESVRRADAIVGGLTSAAAARKLQAGPGDLNPFVEGIRELLMEDELAGGGVAFELDLGAEVSRAVFDPEELRQACINVILNAAGAMPDGGTITVSTRDEVAADVPADEGGRSGERLRNGQASAVIEVRDEGPGVSDDVLNRMFDPFFTTRATGLGTGLGLTVTKKIMDLHGGVIAVRNRDDRTGLSVKLMLRVKRFPFG